MEREQVQEAIDTAFGGLSIPKRRTIIGDVDAKDRLSAETFRRDIAGKSWQNLTPKFLAEWWAWYGYLTPEAYRYYVAALMTEALKNFEESYGLIYSAVAALSPSLASLYHEGCDANLRSKQSTLTMPQCSAICAFLELAFGLGTGRAKHHAAQALHWGWNQINTPALAAANSYYH